MIGQRKRETSAEFALRLEEAIKLDEENRALNELRAKRRAELELKRLPATTRLDMAFLTLITRLEADLETIHQKW